MTWTIEWEEKALKELNKLDKPVRKKIFKILNDRIANLENPRTSGKPLSYEKYGLRRYRLEFSHNLSNKRCGNNYLVVQVGHRKEVCKE